jgi:excinuclease ABC subunit A
MPPPSGPSGLLVRGARTHNLKGFDVVVPAFSFTVLTGPSGAGKSSLALDTIYAEAQRRFIELLGESARERFERLPKPDVDAIEGLSPAIAIDARPLSGSPRSTLGTATEIADYVRLLYARAGTARCPRCGDVVRAETPARIVDGALAQPEKTKIAVLAPVLRGAAGDLVQAFDELRRQGFVRAKVDGVAIDLGEHERLDPKRLGVRALSEPHDLDVVVDRVVLKADRDANRRRLADSVELSLRGFDGRVGFEIERPDGARAIEWHSERPTCPRDGFAFPPLEPALFSFNTPAGACPVCDGVGTRARATEALLVPDARKSLRNGAIVAFGPAGSVAQSVELARLVEALGPHGVDPDAPWSALAADARAAILSGAPASAASAANGEAVIDAPRVRGRKRVASAASARGPYEGVIRWVDARLAVLGASSADAEEATERDDEGALDERGLRALLEEHVCDGCHGARLRPEALAIDVAGVSIAALAARPLGAARAHLEAFRDACPAELLPIVRPIVDAAAARLAVLESIGVGYLSIDRPVASMSGGERQRVRLAAQLSGAMRGLLYVIDEPSIGLHPRDVERVITHLRALRDAGNTVLAVEHDLDVVRAADRVIDIGPKAGRDGGFLLAEGTIDEIVASPASVTGPWLDGRARLPKPTRCAPDAGRQLRVRAVTKHNLRGLDLDVPLGLLVGVAGPSGSGKSTLVADVLVPALRAAVASASDRASIAGGSIEGAASIDALVSIDAAPIGRTPRSNAASYVGALPLLRELFAQTAEARARGFKAARFSTNVKGGRCEACRGDGVVRVEMAFLPDVLVTCADCNGSRFDRETLEIRWRGRTIADVLAMSVDDARAHFDPVPRIRERFDALLRLGLGYLVIGQPAPTLSGGEAQRIKLARELSRRSGERTLYVLDEPTTGLHSVDVALLLEALVELRDQGRSVIVVEHDAELLARMDWVIELGPGAGDAGGQVVAAGPPEQIARAATASAPYLSAALRRP